MFSASTYTDRRQHLIASDEPASGLVLLLGNEQSAMNYQANPYPFRQDSSFLYYFGLDEPGLTGLIDLDDGETCLYGDDPSLDDVIWMGERPSLSEYASRVGVGTTAPRASLADDLSDAIADGRSIHFLPPYRTAHHHRLASLLGLQPERLEAYASTPLTRRIAAQRSTKSEEEIDQLETAVDITAVMHETAMHMAAPGRTEREIAGRLSGIAEARGQGLSFRPTCSLHGEVLHNHEYDNALEANDLLLVDAGAASPLHYAGDITRVVPVGGRFTSRQQAIYEAVLDAQTEAIDALRPGVPFWEIHLLAARILTEHLVEIGLMNGPVDAAVDAGAHALFFPHGLGHMLGLDTHDMENLGEDIVGYADAQTRSDQFGLHALRLARPLEPGFALTVEPGCYFIPALIDQWRQDQRHAKFINYDTVADFESFGGIRIEDDVVITEAGAEVLGPGIPKTVAEVEAQASQ
jgi:Xaa-Pro aminopeptidase